MISLVDNNYTIRIFFNIFVNKVKFEVESFCNIIQAVEIFDEFEEEIDDILFYCDKEKIDDHSHEYLELFVFELGHDWIVVESIKTLIEKLSKLKSTEDIEIEKLHIYMFSKNESILQKIRDFNDNTSKFFSRAI